MADVVLINPPPVGLDLARPPTPGPVSKSVALQAIGQAMRQRSATPPLGLMYVAAYLRKHGYSVAIIDLRQQRLSHQAFFERLTHESPRAVGISVFTELYPGALQIAQAIKMWNPSVWIVMGGTHVTFVDKDPLHIGWVDVVVRHEGEQTMLDLVRQLFDRGESGLASVDGITYAIRKGTNTTIRRNLPRPPLADLDSLPLPARDLVNLPAYYRSGLMITSRGCPGRCIFCAAAAMAGSRYRPRSVASVIEEMRYLRQELHCSTVSIADDTLTALPRRLQEICQWLIETQFAGTWTCESRVDHVTPELLRLMVQAGCCAIQFGVESGDPAVLKAIRKGTTVKQIEQAVRWAKEADLKVKCSAIIGHHVDTPASIRMTIDFLARLQDTYGVTVALGINTPFPGTFLYEHASELGVRILAHDWSEYVFGRAIIETMHLSRAEIQRWYQQALLHTSPIAVEPVLTALGEKLNMNREALIQLIADATLKMPMSADARTTSVWAEAG